MTDLYRYLPTFIRLRDRLASGLSDDDSEEAVLEKLCSMLAAVFDENDDFIKALHDLQDPDRCDSAYFMHVSYILGTLLPTGGNEARTRFIIKNLVSHYKTKGTHHSWTTGWHWQDITRPSVVELWKTTPNEINDYTFAPDTNHPLKSARIDLTACGTVCETICESVCETYCEENVEFGVPLSRSQARARLRYVDDLRPIHVLLRLDASEYLLRSGFPLSEDTLGHYPMPYDRQPETWLGSYVEAELEDTAFPTSEDLVIEVECLSACETACQGCCEIECECDACELNCQAGGCELDCTAGCQGFCEFECEAACQFGCTGGCQGHCTGSCEGSCTSRSMCTPHACGGTCQLSNEACQAACQGAGDEA